MARFTTLCTASHRVNAPVFPRMASQRSGSSSPSNGDHYNSETARASSCWSTRTWHLDDNLGLRAEDTAPRNDAPHDSGRPERVRPRQETMLAGPAIRQLPRNSAEEPTQASIARLVRSALRQHVAKLPASRSTFTSAALRTASLCPFFGASVQPGFGAPGQPGIMPQGMHSGIKTLNNQ